MPNVRAMLTFRVPAGSPADGGDPGDGRLDALQIVRDREAEGFARFRQTQLPRRTMKQPHTEVPLQRGDVPADGGRSQRQAPGGLGEAAMLRAADEGFQVRQGFHDATFKG